MRAVAEYCRHLLWHIRDCGRTGHYIDQGTYIEWYEQTRDALDRASNA